MTAHDALEPTALHVLAPPPKRARCAEPLATVSKTTHQNSAAERLHAALSKGVFSFLVLEDVAALAQSCRLVRLDTPLLATATRLLPDFKQLFPDESSVVFRDLWTKDLDARVAPEQGAQVINTAAFLKKRVAKWCFEYDPKRPDPDDDLLCSVQVVLIPLAQFRDDAAEPQGAAKPGKWSRQPIKQSLNAFCSGGGDAFFDVKSAAESRFATHWDSVFIDRVSGRVSCRLCDAVRDSLALYKRQVEVGLRQYGLVLRHKEETWAGKSPEEIQQLTEEFRAKYFPADAYIRPECAEWPDQRLLRHICEHGKLQSWQIGDTRARGIASVDALLRAVSFKYQHQCRTFYQPLKKSLNRKCQVIGRIPHAVLQNLRVPKTDSDAENKENERVLTELVGGVEVSSGIFTGVQVTFRLTR